MLRTLTTAGTGMMAQQMNLDTIANNLANVNTTGYKSQRAEFQDLMYQTVRASGAPESGAITQPVAFQVGMGSKFASNSINFTSGALQSTGNPLDVSISGDGFFVVQRADGSNAYTRDGGFKQDANGLMVTNDGYHLSPEITIPAGATAVSISSSGIVSAILPGKNEPEQLGQITIATFPNASGLTGIGQNLFMEGGNSGTAQIVNPGEQGTGTLQSGFLEASNVSVVEEMVRMITAQRAYEINSRAITTADEMLQVVNQLKR